MKYVHRPVVVDAYQWDGDRTSLPDWLKQSWNIRGSRHVLRLTCLGNAHSVSIGQWVVATAHGINITIYEDSWFHHLFKRAERIEVTGD